MSKQVICGIQQVGVGVPDLESAFKWYRRTFGMDILIFEDDGVAGLMQAYTGGKARERHALLIGNLQGGSGVELWQYRTRRPEPPAFDVRLGDLGIFVVKIKAYDIPRCYSTFLSKKRDVLCEPQEDPAGGKHFFLRDPLGSIFQVVQGQEWFAKGKHITGGVSGCIIGVSDIESSRAIYSDILGYDMVLYDKRGTFSDLNALSGGQSEIRRVLLGHRNKRIGSFSLIYGSSQIELVQVLDRKPRRIFESRYWGDLGFIHLCFDVRRMNALKEECDRKGFPFTVDSMDRFDMGSAAGHFSYVEDPDGTLIEFVETHRIPIIRKLGWYLNLQKRRAEKSLPGWLLKFLSLSRVKD